MKRVICIAILLFFWVPQPDAQTASFKVIIHADNPETELEMDRIAKMFIRKIKRWEDGTAVVPVDQEDGSPAREAFTREIHGKRVSAIESYWQRIIFSGRGVPPDKLTSDKAVIDFVGSERGAIGYVDGGVDLGDQVKELKVLEKP